MRDIVYVSFARGIRQNAIAATCDDTQLPAGPDRCPQMEKAPDPTAPLPAPGGAATLPAPWGAANMTAPGGASSSPTRRSDKVAELEDLNKAPEPSSTLPAPGGAANLALAMAMAMVLTAAARQAKQLGNPSCLVSKAAAATSLSKTGTAQSAVAGNRYGDV